MAAATTPVIEDPFLVSLRDVGKGIAASRDAMTFVTDPAVLGDGLCELIGLATELASLRLQLVTQCEANDVPGSIDVRTIGQYVAARTNSSTRGTNTDSKLVEWLRDYPAFAQALERRDMTIEHLQHLRIKLDNIRTASKLKGDQQFFADVARDTSFSQFKKACDYWLIIIDPDGKEPIDQLESSGVSVTVGSSGRVKIVIEPDAVTGSAMVTMIEHESKTIRAQDIANNIERTSRQRRQAAVYALMERGFRRQDGTHPVPLFNIVMSQRVAEWALNHLNNPNCDCDTVPVHPLDVDGRCELINGQPVHPLLVAAVLGLHRFDTPTLRRYVMTADSRIVDYSYNARTAPEHLRTASHIEHRGECSTHGCDTPHSWLQIDHIDPASNGGATRLRNVEPKCEPDNQAKGATTGHQAWKDRPPPTRHRPRRTNNNDDPDDPDDEKPPQQ